MADLEDTMSNNDDTDAESQDTAAEPLATTRARRSNAGNLMSKMIQDEEDEFYANLYGGFHEEEDDVDFESDQEGNELDDDYDVDSDFSIDETDEIAAEHQEVDDEPKKKKSVYREPKPKTSIKTTSETPLTKPKAGSSHTPQSPGKRPERSFRDSTRKKTQETMLNIKSGDRRKRRKIRNMAVWKPLSQDELLAEAKVTEEENIKSLETYQRLESEKLKKIKQIKKTLPTPYMTYFSTTMPILGTEDRYTRNFITFVS